MRGEMAVSDGQVTASGATEVVRIEGDYTLDEETGLITVEDKSNMHREHPPCHMSRCQTSRTSPR